MDPEISVAFNSINERLSSLENKMDTLLEICRETRAVSENNLESCQRMDSHITFVNGAYSSLRAPLDFIQRKFSSNAPALPPSSSEV